MMCNTRRALLSPRQCSCRFRPILTAALVLTGVLLSGAFGHDSLANPVDLVSTVSGFSPRVRSITVYVFVAGALAFAGFFNLTVFLLRRREAAPGYLALTCLALTINVLLPNTSLLPLDRVMPWLTGALLQRIDLVTLSTVIAAGQLLLRRLFPLDVSRIAAVTVVWASALTVAAVLIVPSAMVGTAYNIYVGFVAAFCLYVVWVSVRSVVFRRPDAVLVAAGMALAGVGGGIDALMVLGILPPLPMFLPFALVAVAAIMSFIIARRFTAAFYATERARAELQEKNEALARMDAIKEEMRRRTRQEQHLRMVQRRLAETLDTVPLPVCAVDDNAAIAFANEQAHQLLSPGSESILGKPIDIFASPLSPDADQSQPLSERCSQLDAGSHEREDVTLGGTATEEVRRVVEMIPLSLDNDELTVLLFHPPDETPADEKTFGLVVEELNRNRRRLDRLNRALARSTPGEPIDFATVRQDLGAIDAALAHMGAALHESETDRPAIGREVMTLAKTYWEECTGMTTLELAHESGLWHVDVSPDGHERTRTLDRYFDIRTFPRRPRWKQIEATGDFVLARCTELSETRRKLEEALSRLRISG
ncbi:MAG: hypothetical protein GF331_14130 [Chitinivibrionales bacterium]|nr:hypothetical protein [Chitinivibrionales bacterium]